VCAEGFPRRPRDFIGCNRRRRETFAAFKWKKPDTFEFCRRRYARARHGIEPVWRRCQSPWLVEHGNTPLMIDAGCGGRHVGALNCLGRWFHG